MPNIKSWLEQEDESVLVIKSSLDLATVGRQMAHLFLSPEEIKKYQKYLCEADQDRSILAWTIVRLVIARKYLCHPTSVRFQDNGYGKLLTHGLASALRFNISHSDSFVAAAFAFNQDVGIDTERVRQIPRLLEISNSQFHPSEAHAIAVQPPQKRLHAFFACWTRKEALIKGIGLGFSIPLKTFVVTTDPDGPAKIIKAPDTARAGSPWALMDLEISSGYRSALAVQTEPQPAIHLIELTRNEFLDLATTYVKYFRV